jgi:hypothetical protein
MFKKAKNKQIFNTGNNNLSIIRLKRSNCVVVGESSQVLQPSKNAVKISLVREKIKAILLGVTSRLYVNRVCKNAESKKINKPTPDLVSSTRIARPSAVIKK